MSVSSIASKPSVAATPRLPDVASRQSDDEPDPANDGFAALLDGADPNTTAVRPEQAGTPAAAGGPGA